MWFVLAGAVLENAWRVQDWTAMKEASTQAEPICTESYSAKLNLLRGFLALCYPDEQRLSAVSCRQMVLYEYVVLTVRVLLFVSPSMVLYMYS